MSLFTEYIFQFRTTDSSQHIEWLSHRDWRWHQGWRRHVALGQYRLYLWYLRSGWLTFSEAVSLMENTLYRSRQMHGSEVYDGEAGGSDIYDSNTLPIEGLNTGLK